MIVVRFDPSQIRHASVTGRYTFCGRRVADARYRWPGLPKMVTCKKCRHNGTGWFSYPSHR